MRKKSITMYTLYYTTEHSQRTKPFERRTSRNWGSDENMAGRFITSPSICPAHTTPLRTRLPEEQFLFIEARCIAAKLMRTNVYIRSISKNAANKIVVLKLSALFNMLLHNFKTMKNGRRMPLLVQNWKAKILPWRNGLNQPPFQLLRSRIASHKEHRLTRKTASKHESQNSERKQEKSRLEHRRNPEIVDLRTEFGHWRGRHGDLEKGENEPCMITLMERLTRMCLWIQAVNNTAEAVTKALRKVMSTLLKDTIRCLKPLPVTTACSLRNSRDRRKFCVKAE